MHKYQPRVHIMKKRDSNVDPRTVNLENEEVKTFTFVETQFMAVTAYQNQLVWCFHKFPMKDHSRSQKVLLGKPVNVAFLFPSLTPYFFDSKQNLVVV